MGGSVGYRQTVKYRLALRENIDTLKGFLLGSANNHSEPQRLSGNKDDYVG